MSETIAAIATPPATRHSPGGISVIRISGPDAFAVADRVFRPRSGGRLAEKKGYTAAFGGIGPEMGRELDEGVATVFRAPKSYTGEDTVELSCHGGMVVTREVLRAVLAAGARLAQPGEFTKRAFLNGKLSLTQAEATADLLAAQSREAARAAGAQQHGALAQKLRQLLEQLLETAAQLAVWADYPEEDLPPLDPVVLSGRLTDAAAELSRLLGDYDAGLLLREGIDTVLAGKPNVGKSTLMNRLAGGERSIVTDVAGTTRDVVEETVELDGLLLRLSDTAGLRETNDPVEQIGVGRARERLSRAALVLAVFDASQPLSPEDISLVESLRDQPALALVNKSDLPPRLDDTLLRERFDCVLTLSAADPGCLAALSRAIREKAGLLDYDPDAPQLATERQRDCAVRALAALREAQEALAAGLTLDAVTVSVEAAVQALLELSGQRATEAVVDAVFARFCVGK